MMSEPPSTEPAARKDWHALWMAALRHLLDRAPCLFPAIAVLGAALGGYCWCLTVVVLLLARFVGMRRIFYACLVCAAIVLVRQVQLERASFDILDRLESEGNVTVKGTVVRQLARGGIVETAWNGTRVAVYGQEPLHCGDEVEVFGTARDVEEPLVEGMFDPRRWMRGQGICAGVDLVRLKVQGCPPSWSALCGASHGVRGALERILMPKGAEEDPRRQVLCALMLGDKSGADPTTLIEFQRGGCMHAFAVSGLHVGLVAGILLLVLRLAHVPPGAARYVLLIALAVYVWVTGMAVPALRAYLMLAVVLGARIMVRQVGLLNIWCFAGLVLLLFSPWQVYQSGFQLSFAVYGALCLGVRLCMKDSPWFGPDPYIPFRIRTDAELRMRNIELWVRGVVLVSVCAWVGSLPLTYSNFHAFNTYGVLTNIAITPILPLVMMAGFLHMCCFAIPWLGVVTDSFAVHASGLLVSVVSFFAGLPASYIPACPASQPQEAVVLQLRYGNSVCALGNPGLLIDCGNLGDARYTVQPYLFHAGFSPAVLLETRSLASRTGGKGFLRPFWPGLQEVTVPPGRTSSLKTAAGEYRIYGAPADISPSPAANLCPVVTWKSPRGLVVYIGDASLATLENVPEDLSRAVWVVLGHNKGQTVDPESLTRRMPGARILLLPPAIEAGVQAQEFSPLPVHLLDEKTRMLRLE